MAGTLIALRTLTFITSPAG